jgi:cell pole-organizing protein PopZ
MQQTEESLESTLQAIRKLMSSSNKEQGYKEDDEDILELSEDDILDEQDEDAYLDYRFEKKETKSDVINENLTPNLDNATDKNLIYNESDNLISAETAAKSIASIKELIKKAEQQNKFLKKEVSNADSLVDITTKELKPFLKEWLNEHLPSIVEGIVEREIKQLLHQKDKKDD